jgi:hypothetical protein
MVMALQRLFIWVGLLWCVGALGISSAMAGEPSDPSVHRCAKRLARHTRIQTTWSETKRGWLKPYVTFMAEKAEPCLIQRKMAALHQLQGLEIHEDAMTLIQIADPVEYLPDDQPKH